MVVLALLNQLVEIFQELHCGPWARIWLVIPKFAPVADILDERSISDIVSHYATRKYAEIKPHSATGKSYIPQTERSPLHSGSIIPAMMHIAPSPLQIQLDNLRLFLTAAVDSVEILADAANLPLLKPISITVRTLLKSVESVRHKKNECIQLMKRLHEILYGIVDLHIRTLHKVYNFVDAQQETSKFRQILRSGEMKALFRDCTTELQQALDTFKIQGVNFLADVKALGEYARQTEREILHLIATASDETSSDASSVYLPSRCSFSVN
ncbi:hypothetical protein B0H19DRAFT_1074015 [Mycena capillaripes]|nr:hypothetical protein B0H19DRAFT_1074015 [Mycena capillaripes]